MDDDFALNIYYDLLEINHDFWFHFFGRVKTRLGRIYLVLTRPKKGNPKIMIDLKQIIINVKCKIIQMSWKLQAIFGLLLSVLTINTCHLVIEIWTIPKNLHFNIIQGGDQYWEGRSRDGIENLEKSNLCTDLLSKIGLMSYSFTVYINSSINQKKIHIWTLQKYYNHLKRDIFFKLKSFIISHKRKFRVYNFDFSKVPNSDSFVFSSLFIIKYSLLATLGNKDPVSPVGNPAT